MCVCVCVCVCVFVCVFVCVCLCVCFCVCNFNSLIWIVFKCYFTNSTYIFSKTVHFPWPSMFFHDVSKFSFKVTLIQEFVLTFLKNERACCPWRHATKEEKFTFQLKLRSLCLLFQIVIIVERVGFCWGNKFFMIKRRSLLIQNLQTERSGHMQVQFSICNLR